MQNGDPNPGRPLLPGSVIDPRRLYLFTSAAMGGLVTLAFTTYGLYVVNEVGLEPLQLVLEGAVLISEISTGVVADIYSRRLSVVSGSQTTT